MDYEELIRFLLTNDIYGEPALDRKEFYDFEKRFYDKSLEHLFRVPSDYLDKYFKDNEKIQKIFDAVKRDCSAFLDSLKDFNIKIITNWDKEYPLRLRKKLGDEAPPILYTVGDVALLNKRSVAVTGSRKMSELGERFSFDIGEIIANEKRVLVSGGAYGCDRNATETAIKNGGKAVWFVAVPIMEMLSNRQVSNWISNGDLVICSDFDPFGKFDGKIALRRNHYIYANAETAFVCQCNSKISGTYSGASYALRNKLCELFVFDNNSEGERLLIKNGAISVIDA